MSPSPNGNVYDTASSDIGHRRETSNTTLANKEQQLREEIARLKREEQELREKDLWIKQNIVAVREKMMMADRR